MSRTHHNIITSCRVKMILAFRRIVLFFAPPDEVMSLCQGVSGHGQLLRTDASLWQSEERAPLQAALRQACSCPPARAGSCRLWRGATRRPGAGGASRSDVRGDWTIRRVSKNAVFGLNFLPGFWTCKYRL